MKTRFPCLSLCLRGSAPENYGKTVEFCAGMFPSYFVAESDDLILILGCALKRASRTYPRKRTGLLVGQRTYIRNRLNNP